VTAPARAFGLELDAGFPVHGLSPPGSSPGRGDTSHTVRLEAATRRELAAAWPRDGATRLSDRRDAAGRTALSIDWHPRAGHLMWGRGYGAYLISADARLVACAPVRRPAWRGQRYLLGQVLPFLAVLHGFEVLHASAVLVDGHAVAVVGQSGSGKSSLGAHLRLRGAQFLTDDVLAIEPHPHGVLAHPGPAVTSIRRDFLATLAPDEVTALGRPAARDRDALRLLVNGADDPALLRAVYFLHRERGHAGARIRPTPLGDPRLLLAGTYNFVIRTPDRLRAQLDVCARLAETAACFELQVPEGVGAAAVADLMREHAHEIRL
jgi:hypothetical protein